MAAPGSESSQALETNMDVDYVVSYRFDDKGNLLGTQC